MQSASIEFLPCRYGGGYSASISGFWGNHDVEGWVTGAYDNLRGIVVEPEPECLERSEWLRVVRRHLLEQGVVFIAREKVQKYLDTEGAYWIDKWGATGQWHGVGQWRQARTPRFGERLLWRWKPPSLPVDGELIRKGMQWARCPTPAGTGRTACATRQSSMGPGAAGQRGDPR